MKTKLLFLGTLTSTFSLSAQTAPFETFKCNNGSNRTVKGTLSQFAAPHT